MSVSVSGGLGMSVESIGVCRCLQVSVSVCGVSVGAFRCLWCLYVSVSACGVSLGVKGLCAGVFQFL